MRVLVYDHNWDCPDYPQAVLADPIIAASPLVAGTVLHGYGGGPGAMLALDSAYPLRGNYQTEHSGGTWVTNQVKEDLRGNHHAMRSSGRAFVKWGIALDENHGPHAGGCGTCALGVTVHPNGEVTNAIEFYSTGRLQPVRPSLCVPHLHQQRRGPHQRRLSQHGRLEGGRRLQRGA